MSYKIEKITESLELGEGPHWDENTQSLYFVDALGKSVCRYIPSTKSFSKAAVGEKTVAFIIPIEGRQGKFVIGFGNELAILTWDGKSDKISSLETIVELKNEGETVHQFNDAKADSFGRLWAGVMYPKPEHSGFYPNKGSLYTLRPDRTLKKLVGNITLTNGLAWNEDIKKFYYIDSLDHAVYQFDCDIKNTEISNQQTIFKFQEPRLSGFPDGMTIDSDGNLWVAAFGDSKVVKIDPRRPDTILQTIDIPSVQVTSVAFGGPNLDELYVTTGKIAAFGKAEPEGPGQGATYKVTGIGVKGLLPYKVKL